MENLKPCPLCGGKAINRVVEKNNSQRLLRNSMREM